MTEREPESAISPIIAEILMVALVCLAAGVAYVFLFQLPGLDTIPMVAVDITKSGNLITLFHKNGDPLEQGTFYVTVNGDRVPDGNVSLVGGTYPWSSGERLVVNYTGTRATSDVKLIYAKPPGPVVLASAYFTALSGNLTPVNITPVYARYPGFTAEAWVKWNVPTDPGTDTTKRWATIVVDGDRDSNRRYQLEHNQLNSLFEFSAATSSANPQVWSTTSPVANTWYHVVGIYNQTDPGNRLRIYVNGVNEKSTSIDGGGLRASPNRYQVGGPAGIQWPGPANMLRKFNGEIRGLKTYEEALSQAEILAHYQAGAP
jgi:FlaG/FlaF family flagellin (archaellin)